MDTLDGSSNSLPEEEEEDFEDDYEWGLQKGMSLFEVSAKDDYGMHNVTNLHLLTSLTLTLPYPFRCEESI